MLVLFICMTSIDFLNIFQCWFQSCIGNRYDKWFYQCLKIRARKVQTSKGRVCQGIQEILRNNIIIKKITKHYDLNLHSSNKFVILFECLGFQFKRLQWPCWWMANKTSAMLRRGTRMGTFHSNKEGLIFLQKKYNYNILWNLTTEILFLMFRFNFSCIWNKLRNIYVIPKYLVLYWT